MSLSLSDMFFTSICHIADLVRNIASLSAAWTTSSSPSQAVELFCESVSPRTFLSVILLAIYGFLFLVFQILAYVFSLLDLMSFIERVVAEPAARRQRTEASDGQDESEDDSNFDNIDCDEFDQELWSPEEREELATAKVLLSDAAVQDAKLVCATVWPLNFGTDALAKVVAMIKPEPTSDKTQFVQALMSKCDAFKQLGKLAVSTHTSWVEFHDWVKTTSVTWTALGKFEKETDDILTTSGSQAEENHGNIVQSITVWSQAATERRRRFETLKKSAKLLHDLPTLFPDDRILGDYAIVFKEKKNKVINLVTSIATLSKRLYFSTLAHLLRMAPAAPVKKVEVAVSMG